MQYIIKTYVATIVFISPILINAQSTLLPQGHKHAHFLDRLEILMQTNPDLNFSITKPMSRKLAVDAVRKADSVNEVRENLFSLVDRHNLQSFLMNNSEWVPSKEDFLSKRNLWNLFYVSKANFLEVNEKDFFLAVNPIIQQQQSIENDNDQRIFLNSKGVSVRGLIARKIGFSAWLTDNQERPPRFVQSRINDMQAVPGVGFYKPFKTTAYDYFDARGTIHFTAAKYLDFQFGYDKNFLGHGYRSLYLSDFGNSYLFLKINTRIWKINYQNLFMELAPQFRSNPGNMLLDKKYAAMHHLSLNVTPWLNVGIFEAIVFGRKNRFDFTYLNPIIFLRAAEQQNGSADNAHVGLDIKANVAGRWQIYGKWMLDEFFLKEVRAGTGWWANKFAFQLGGKYVDAFSVRNLDLHGEVNWVRPFTYSHYDSVANYSHYNQPLAHPFGANFMEAIGIVHYQPHPRWTAQGKLIVWEQGLDTASRNFGGNILKANTTRDADYGFTIPSGVPLQGVNAQCLISYEPRENLFFDLNVLVRRVRSSEIPSLNRNTFVLTAGLRLNMFRREYDY